MVDSINTNAGGFAALRALVQANTNLGRSQNRLSTGLRVPGAVADASTFAIAQGTRADLQAGQAVQQGLAAGRGLTTVSLAGSTAVSNLLAEARGIAIAALNPANSQEQANILVSQFNSLVNQVGQAIGDAGFNGANLLQAGASDVQVVSDSEGGTLTISAQDLQAGVVDTLVAGDIAGAVAAVQAGGGGGGLPAAAQNLLNALDSAESATNSALASFGSDAGALDSQSRFLTAIEDATTEALGASVDANLGRESTLLAANQARQQLALTGLSIANSQPQALLGLLAQAAP